MVMVPVSLIFLIVPSWASAGAASASEATAAVTRMRAETTAFLVRSMARNLQFGCMCSRLCGGRPLRALGYPPRDWRTITLCTGAFMNFPDEEQKQALLEQAA